MSQRIVNCENSGQVFVFSDVWNNSDGKVNQLSYKIAPGKSVLPHIHPGVVQWFQVLSGKLSVRVGFKKKIISVGEIVRTQLGGQHSQWNDTNDIVEVLEGYEPALDIEPFFTILQHAEKENFLKKMVFFSDFSFVVTSKSHVAKSIIWGLGKIGNILGYKFWYVAHIRNLKCTEFRKRFPTAF
jgi:quercetin dioxygenase-like cupin family protein